jgi:predicted metal-dependent hydrolase
MNNSPKILAFVRDLNLEVRIESTAQRSGFEVIFVETAEQISAQDESQDEYHFDDIYQSRNGKLIDKITTSRPVLIIFDLGNDLVPWQEWIGLISSDPATRRIPIICYGSHVDVTRLQAAKKAGAEAVVARSRFFNSMPDLLVKHARYKSANQLEEMCQQPLSDLAIQGLEEFNRGEYFEAHESLELAWVEDKSPGRDVYRAALQIAVAYYQVTRGNYRGARKMFLRLRQWLDPLPEVCRGINISQIRAEVDEVHQTVIALGSEKINEFDLNLLHPIEYKS